MQLMQLVQGFTSVHGRLRANGSRAVQLPLPGLLVLWAADRWQPQHSVYSSVCAAVSVVSVVYLLCVCCASVPAVKVVGARMYVPVTEEVWLDRHRMPLCGEGVEQ